MKIIRRYIENGLIQKPPLSAITTPICIDQGGGSELDLNLMKRILPILLEGLQVTLTLSFSSILLACSLGLILAVFQHASSGWRRMLFSLYVMPIRNTPLLVQIYVVYFALPSIGVAFPSYWCGLLALVLHGAAYFSEIFRGGLEAIPKGQIEAAQSLGLRKRHTYLFVLLPSAIRTTLPSSTSQTMAMIKDTALVSTIGVMDVLKMSQVAAERSAGTIDAFICVGLIYLAITGCVSIAGALAERKLASTGF